MFQPAQNNAAQSFVVSDIFVFAKEKEKGKKNSYNLSQYFVKCSIVNKYLFSILI